MRRAFYIAAIVVIVLMIAIEWLLATGFESPMAVVMPVSIVAVVLGVSALVGSVAILRGAPRIFLAAAAGLPVGWVVWQEWVCISCREVQVDSSGVHSSGVHISGTLCVPTSGEGHPGAVFVHGSGSQTRDETLFYAKYLARRGIVAVAYDKRGAGLSGGDTYGTGYDGYAADAQAFAELIRRHPTVDPDRVGYVGFSEAEWVIPLALVDSPAVFAVIIGASGLTPQQQVGESIAIRLQRAGFGPADVAEAQAVHTGLRDYLHNDIAKEAFAAILEEARSKPWFSIAARNLPAEVPPRSEYAWWLSVMDFDPERSWSTFSGRVLLLKGGRDDRSDARQAESRMRRMLPASASADVLIYDDADHSLLEWPLGDRVPPPAWPSGYPEALATWIARDG